MILTDKQEATMRLFITEGECNEGMMADLWPLIRRPRNVMNSLVDKGLVYPGPYWGDEAGYELLLTPLGGDVVAALRGVEHPAESVDLAHAMTEGDLS